MPTPPLAEPPISRSGSGDLPEAYGTERLFLTARDPHWLYASWDLTAAQRQRYAALARDKQLVLRTSAQPPSDVLAQEVSAAPEIKSWFLYVPRAATCYVSELGYYDYSGQWTSITTSRATFTPPESVSQSTALDFATIPPEVSLKKLFEVVEETIQDTPPLMEALQVLQQEPPLPEPADTTPAAAPDKPERPIKAPVSERVVPIPVMPISERPVPTPASERAISTPASHQPSETVAPVTRDRSSSAATSIAQIVRLDETRRVWMGSLEITELIRRHLQQEISSVAQAVPPAGIEEVGPGAPLALPLPGVSSPLGPEQPEVSEQPGFWLTINAELVLYGATEQDARVSIGGRQIRLRPDGTFSYRFSLPDGEFPLTITAESARGAGSRAVELQFSRRTCHRGKVDTHPQDSQLQPPRPESME